MHGHAGSGHAHDVPLLQHGELSLRLVVIVLLLELEEAGQFFGGGPEAPQRREARRRDCIKTGNVCARTRLVFFLEKNIRWSG